MAEAMTSPARNGAAITTSNDAADDKPGLFRSLWAAGTGDIAVVHVTGGSTVVYANVQGGTVLPVIGVRVATTGTTATGLVGMQ